MNDEEKKMAKEARARAWGEFRFSVIGQLLASPPEKGYLYGELLKLSEKSWEHPITGNPRKFSFATIERWFYEAKREHDNPVEKLQNKIRSDMGGRRVVTEQVKQSLKEQYDQFRSWSYKLHSDNLAALMRQKDMGKPPSYSTVRRYLQSIGCIKEKRKRNDMRDGYHQARYKGDQLEIRSYENEYVSGLWHLDFHHCSREVVTSFGEIVRPLALGIVDDHSRLLCHIQWYLAESAENLVHGFIQSLQKRGRPRSLLTDNGSAMVSQEFTQGLKRLGIHPKTTLAYSPYQNGKQEVLWAQVEGRLLAMLKNRKHLTLKELNDVTLAWAEIEYNKSTHQEIKTSPLKRFLQDKDVSRDCPPLEILKDAFRREVNRTIRKSDTTISVEGIRYELPYRYKHLPRVTVRYAKWDMGLVHLVDKNTGKEICRIYPVDKKKNADGRRKSTCFSEKTVEMDLATPKNELPPLMLEILAEQAATGLPPAYQPKES